ncbi:unnamed protein product [Mytilus coruscus]|uniref:Reverse transcriptase domain-containing protein n=1 Tax=Mytilus coruscus TaxID=42192 RepID=A0A6J8F227_MYTCO|nr:unnamed protein product [Mytilus coruscus]
MDGHFKQPPEMDFSHEDNLSEKWKRWKQTMNLYLEVAMGEKTEKEQCRAVLYVIGLEGREIYNTFNFGENEADKLEVLLKKFEGLLHYLTDLKLIAKNCEFEHLKDGLIRDRIVCGTNSSRVKERLLREDGLTLDKAVGICRADEESRKQMKTLNEEEQVHALRRKTQNQRTNCNEGYAKKGPSRRDHEKRESNSEFQLWKVRNNSPEKKLSRLRKKCHKCKKKPNHYQKFCKSKFSKSVHGLDEYSSCESDGENYFVGAVNRKTEIKENACFSSFKLQEIVKRQIKQLRMDKESQLLTTFNSPFGRYCFLRMPFGIKSAQEVFQNECQLFENLKGVETDIDDILVWGTTRKEHDDRLRSVLNRCQEVGLTLNAENASFESKR